MKKTLLTAIIVAISFVSFSQFYSGIPKSVLDSLNKRDSSFYARLQKESLHNTINLDSINYAFRGSIYSRPQQYLLNGTATLGGISTQKTFLLDNNDEFVIDKSRYKATELKKLLDKQRESASSQYTIFFSSGDKPEFNFFKIGDKKYSAKEVSEMLDWFREFKKPRIYISPLYRPPQNDIMLLPYITEFLDTVPLKTIWLNDTTHIKRKRR